MHPAYSVILFTTASGAGYGLLIWLALLAALGSIPVDGLLGFVGLGLAMILVVAGLMSSTFHLGRPERAWRAMSQWRTSWLSREGVLAIATFVPVAIFGLPWVFFETMDGPLAIAAGAAAALALATVWCTGMIYASLPTIRAWAQPEVAPVYLLLSLGTGALASNAILAIFGEYATWMAWLAVLPLAAAWYLKTTLWERMDTGARLATVGSATGLGRYGAVRPLDPPHTQANYVMREMGYAVARKHAEKLRRVVAVMLFLAPMVLSTLTIVGETYEPTVILTWLSLLLAGVGVAVERWLFFAEAEHVVMVYYGRDAA